MAISSPEMLFFQVVEECIAGTISKEQALQRLGTRYKSVHKDIKKELGEDHISFCCYVPCDLDKWIKICDDAERNKPLDSKWKNSQNTIQKVIEKVTTKYKENELSTENVESEATIDVYKEVYRIQALCRENKETKELYEKYKAEIEHLPDKEKEEKLSAPIIEQMNNPVWLQDEINRTIALLQTERYIKKVKNKDGDFEYRLAEGTTYRKIQDTIKTKKILGIIILPEVEDVDDFIVKHLRGKNGNIQNDALRMMINRDNKTKK